MKLQLLIKPSLPASQHLGSSGHAKSITTTIRLFCLFGLLRSSLSAALTTKTPAAYGQSGVRSSTLYDDSFHVKLNEFFKAPVPAPLKGAISIFREDETTEERLDVEDVVTLLTAAPGSPAVPKPLWLVMLASLPTGLLWYGYYKFTVEEELLQMELDAGKEPRGFGGYGTLGPFTYGMLLGPLASMLHIPGGIQWSSLGVIFIYYTQFLLYDRVNRLYEEDDSACLAAATSGSTGDVNNEIFQNTKPQAPLQVWWCLPIFFPFNLIVGLRQVHFLSQYCYKQRGTLALSDPLADFLPFIKKSSLTWQELVMTPSLWCSAFSDVKSVNPNTLPEPLRSILSNNNSNNNKNN